MELPFDESQFLDVFERYNAVLGPGALVLWLVTAPVVFAWPVHKAVPDRAVAGLLVVHWLWAGLVYHLCFFARINPAAYVFALLFVVQALVLAWYGIRTRRLRFFTTTSRFWRPVSLLLSVYAVAYPLLAWFGYDYPRMPTFGVPCPTTLLTVGFLLSTSPPAPRATLAIPFVWCVVGGSAAFLLGVYADGALLVAGALLLAHAALRRWPADALDSGYPNRSSCPSDGRRKA